MNGVFLVINIAIVILFIGMVFFCNWQQRIMLLLAAVYATIFENFNMLLAGSDIAGYFYNPEFVVFIWDTPLFVILSWSMLIVSSWIVAQRIYSTQWQQILSATLLVLLIDLSIDIFAIRLDFWNWIGYGWSDGFFGVPSANYAGWFLVTIIFFMVYALLINRGQSWYWLTPIIAYPAFLPLMGLYKLIGQTFAIGKDMQIVVLFSGLALLYMGLVLSRKKSLNWQDRQVQFSLFIRAIFHMFSFCCIILYQISNGPLVLAFCVFFGLELLVFREHWKNIFVRK